MSDITYPEGEWQALRPSKREQSKKDTSPRPERAPLTIKELPTEERPREKLRNFGAATLSDAELLAILLRVGTQGETVVDLSQRLLRDYNGLVGLARAPFSDLAAQHGLGEAKVAQLKAALELGRRLLLATPGDRLKIDSPDKIGPHLVMEMRSFEQEVLRVAILNTNHQLMKMTDVHRGSINSSLVRVAEVFKECIRLNGAAILVAHNHPSGDPTPSRQDVEITEQIVAAGKMLDIDVLDHLIIGDTWISMRARGLGFKG